MRLLLIGVLVFAAVACSETAATTSDPTRPAATATARPGNAAVYERIDALTDCDALQAEFDQADTNGQRQRAAGQSSAASISYMEAADARMRELDCY